MSCHLYTFTFYHCASFICTVALGTIHTISQQYMDTNSTSSQHRSMSPGCQQNDQNTWHKH